MKQRALVILLTIFMGLNSSAQVEFFGGSYDSALSTAIKQSKFVLLDFRADWCKPCLEMEKTTFMDEDLGTYLGSRYISLKVDVDYFEGMDIRDKFNVNQYPTLIVIDPSYEEVYMRLIGFKTAGILMGDLKMLDEDDYDDVSVEKEPKESIKKEPTDVTVSPEPKKDCFLKKWWAKLTS